MRHLRWGILGTASIAKRQAIPAIQASESASVQAIASRDRDRALEVAGRFDIPVACGYDELLQRDDVEAVYIPLPNDLHLPWIEKAARAGKDVLCEKPLGLTADEVVKVQAIAEETGRFIMEGVPSFFHPVHRRAAELVQDGAVGEVRFIRVSLGWSFEGKRDDFRWRKDQGGGALLDLGCYCVDTARRMTGADPQSVVARATFDPETDVDTNAALMIFFPQGATALIDCGILSASRNHYEVIGTNGKIVVKTPFGNRVEARRLTLYDAQGKVKLAETPTAHQIKAQFDAVTQAILNGAPAPYPLSESLANARVLDACMASARAGGSPVRLRPTSG